MPTAETATWIEPIKPLDIGRLHAAKGTGIYGQTTDMLVAAVQNSDFADDPVTIIAGNRHDTEILLLRLLEIAWSLGYHVEARRPLSAKINGTWYHVQSNIATPRIRDIAHGITFIDHDFRQGETK